ncbi:DUF1541 domain-containing protein [Corynebacterium glutamicum]|uniref:YdhK family protein n=1 Tax=Corynebacterium glutamicum TaxID=1718 RepID=UPI003C7ECECC
MKHSVSLIALALASTLVLSACTSSTENAEDNSVTSTTSATLEQGENQHHDSATESSHHEMEHPEDGGPAPSGMVEAVDPTFPIGSEVILKADHMPGMSSAKATIVGAFTTTTYSVSYEPVGGGEPVVDHRWVVHEELVDPSQAPLPDGAEVILDADHMAGMKGAQATIYSSTNETVYMVDIVTEDIRMTNHKWFVESEIAPVE